MVQHVPPRWEHQQAAVDRINGGSAFGLFFDMGTGKSRVVVEVVRERRHRTVLILAPKSACAVWPREFAKYFDAKLWSGDGILLLNKGPVKAKMEAAKVRLRQRPGFRDYPDGFFVHCYRTDEDYDDPTFFVPWNLPES